MSKLVCPSCGSHNIVKNGRIHNGKQNHKCRNCDRQLVINPQQKLIDQATKELIDKLLLEKLPLAGIARVCNVSESWLQGYVNQKYVGVPQQVSVSPKKRAPDDSVWWDVVLCQRKGNKQWIWLALDEATREIVGVYVGNRGEHGAHQLWNSLPSVYHQCAVAYIDFWEATPRRFTA